MKRVQSLCRGLGQGTDRRQEAWRKQLCQRRLRRPATRPALPGQLQNFELVPARATAFRREPAFNNSGEREPIRVGRFPHAGALPPGW